MTLTAVPARIPFRWSGSTAVRPRRVSLRGGGIAEWYNPVLQQAIALRTDILDTAVREHLDQDPVVQEFADQVTAFLGTWIPRFDAETRSYLTIAFGCTGGRHRSVYLTEHLAAHFRLLRPEGIFTYHRELE